MYNAYDTIYLVNVNNQGLAAEKRSNVAGGRAFRRFFHGRVGVAADGGATAGLARDGRRMQQAGPGHKPLTAASGDLGGRPEAVTDQ
jgi:hypothetical protein